MHCDGKLISAIIDTGSQLNMINHQVWKTQINRPVDLGHSILIEHGLYSKTHIVFKLHMKCYVLQMEQILNGHLNHLPGLIPGFP